MCAAGRQSLDPRASEDSLAGLRQEMLRRFEVSLRAAGKVSPTAGKNDGSLDLNDPILTERVGTEQLRRYEAALQKLPAESQQAIVARIELGFSYAQVAVCIGKPNAEDARETVCQALLHLAQQMSDEQP